MTKVNNKLKLKIMELDKIQQKNISDLIEYKQSKMSLLIITSISKAMNIHWFSHNKRACVLQA